MYLFFFKIVHYYVAKTESLSTCQTKRLSTTALVITNNASFSYRMWLSYRMRLDKSQTHGPSVPWRTLYPLRDTCPCCIYHLVPGRRMWIRAPGQENWQCEHLLVPGRRAWMIKLPGFKNPISIVNKIAGYDIWRQILAWYEIWTNKTNYELAKGWSRCPDISNACIWQLMKSWQNGCMCSHRSAQHSTIYLESGNKTFTCINKQLEKFKPFQINFYIINQDETLWKMYYSTTYINV